MQLEPKKQRCRKDKKVTFDAQIPSHPCANWQSINYYPIAQSGQLSKFRSEMVQKWIHEAGRVNVSTT